MPEVRHFNLATVSAASRYYDTNALPAFVENSSFSATLDFKEACMKSLNSG